MPLEYHVLGYREGKSPYLTDFQMNFKLLDVIRNYSAGKPTLVFCNTRKGVCLRLRTGVALLATH